MPFRVNVAGTYRPVIGAWIRFQNAWRRLNGIWVRTGGSWRKAYSPEMDIGPAGTTRYNINLYEEYRKYTGDNSGSPIDFKFNILCNIGSASTSLPSLDCSTIPAGSTIIIINQAWIVGKGGNGGFATTNGNVGNGEAGGLGIRLSPGSSYTIENFSAIGGGGGGGGGNNGVICGGCGYTICCTAYSATGQGGHGLPRGSDGACSGSRCSPSSETQIGGWCSPNNGVCGPFCYYLGGYGGFWGSPGYLPSGCGGCGSGNFCYCCLSWPGFKRGTNGGAGAAIQWNGGSLVLVNRGSVYGSVG